MDKIKEPNKNKFKALLKKESFYLVLFLCICVITTVTGVVIARNNKDKTVATSAAVAQGKNDGTNAGDSVLVKKSASEIAASAVPANIELLKPIDGKIIIPYLGVDGLYPTKDGSKSTLGVYIEAKDNEKVVAAAKGKVEYVGEDLKGNGTIVIIDHQNGYKTVYGNLSKATVEANATVEENQQIGVTGTTSKYTHTFSELEKCPTALYLQVLKKDKDNKFVDVNPKDYVKDLQVAETQQ